MLTLTKTRQNSFLRKRSPRIRSSALLRSMAKKHSSTKTRTSPSQKIKSVPPNTPGGTSFLTTDCFSSVKWPISTSYSYVSCNVSPTSQWPKDHQPLCFPLPLLWLCPWSRTCSRTSSAKPVTKRKMNARSSLPIVILNLFNKSLGNRYVSAR